MVIGPEDETLLRCCEQHPPIEPRDNDGAMGTNLACKIVKGVVSLVASVLVSLVGDRTTVPVRNKDLPV